MSGSIDLQDYLRELELQCRHGLVACTEVNRAMQAMVGQGALGSKIDPLQEVFRNIHSLVCHAGNVSKLLWPNDPPRQSGEDSATHKARSKVAPAIVRGKALRDSLRLPMEAQELKDRRLRNLLEHFDLRLDKWLGDPGKHNAMDMTIGDPAVISGVTYVRVFHPAKGEFILWDEVFDLNKMSGALTAVLKGIRRWEEKQMTPVQCKEWKKLQTQLEAITNPSASAS